MRLEVTERADLARKESVLPRGDAYLAWPYVFEPPWRLLLDRVNVGCILNNKLDKRFCHLSRGDYFNDSRLHNQLSICTRILSRMLFGSQTLQRTKMPLDECFAEQEASSVIPAWIVMQWRDKIIHYSQYESCKYSPWEGTWLNWMSVLEMSPWRESCWYKEHWVFEQWAFREDGHGSMQYITKKNVNLRG